jgi:thiosulfate/3-mercaptopyruvate sulfurtransferase
MLLSAAELEKLLAKPAGGLRLLDVRSTKDFAAGHVPGAVRVDAAAWTRKSRAEGGLEDLDHWARAVGELGVTNDTHVVLYGDPLTDTARVWWLLKYLGHEKLSLLDGSWRLWQDEKRAVETTAARVEPAKFAPRPQSSCLARVNDVKGAAGKDDVVLLDVRSEAEFSGKTGGERSGHIPGAKHLEWKELLLPDGRFKKRDDLVRLFRDRGLDPLKTIVPY